jgi:hypothetical protein
MGSGLSYCVNIPAGKGGPAVAMEMACFRDTTQSSARNGKKLKIFEDLINSKNMVFNVKRLLNVGLGLILQQKGEKNRCERNEWQI